MKKDTLHPSHVTKTSFDSSSYDEKCIHCGATDALGTWGNLANPCLANQESKHPIQPIVMVNGVKRFKSNGIIDYLFENRLIDINMLLSSPQFSEDDKQQFAQLLGYSVSSYNGLSFHDPDVVVQAQAEKHTDPKDALITHQQEQLVLIKNAIKPLVSVLFDIHEDDVK